MFTQNSKIILIARKYSTDNGTVLAAINDLTTQVKYLRVEIAEVKEQQSVTDQENKLSFDEIKKEQIQLKQQQEFGFDVIKKEFGILKRETELGLDGIKKEFGILKRETEFGLDVIKKEQILLKEQMFLQKRDNELSFAEVKQDLVLFKAEVKQQHNIMTKEISDLAILKSEFVDVKVKFGEVKDGQVKLFAKLESFDDRFKGLKDSIDGVNSRTQSAITNCKIIAFLAPIGYLSAAGLAAFLKWGFDYFMSRRAAKLETENNLLQIAGQKESLQIQPPKESDAVPFNASPNHDEDKDVLDVSSSNR